MQSTISLCQDESSAAGVVDAIAFETRLGWMGIAYDHGTLRHLVFGYPTRRALAHDPCFDLVDWIDDVPVAMADLRDRLVAFAAGEEVEFSDIRVANDHLTPFGERVLGECRKLQWGQVRSYAEIAKRAGRPGAARAVGNVMAGNRFPIVVPCHRVVGSGGGLGGYSAPGGLETKRRLLQAEGAL